MLFSRINKIAPQLLVLFLGALLLCSNAHAAVLELRVASSFDDAEESGAGAVSQVDGDLELVNDVENQTVGLRFAGLDLIQGTVITSAYVQFQADESHSGATSLTIEGQLADDAPAFGDGLFDISSRPRTAAAVAWAPQSWTAGDAGVDQRTADIGPIVQEIVSRPGWAAGNSLALIIAGSGKRVAEAFDGLQAAAPLLHVEFVPPPVFDVAVASSSDDAEENPAGDVSLTSSDLELVQDATIQTVGIRFTDLELPAEAIVTSAHLQFQANETNSDPTSLTIEGQAADDAATFGDSIFDISSRPRTSAAVAWAPQPWTAGDAGADQRTPDLASVIHEITSRPGWNSDKALVLIITGTGRRVAEAYDGLVGSPELHVQYELDETDSDGDGVVDAADNCPDDANAGQADSDGDGVGDACDACPLDTTNDADGDGVCGAVDNCPDDANAGQADSDADGPGDACDACPLDAANDADGDGVCGDVDNCPDDANAGQADSDADGSGDTCDACPLDAANDADADGVCGDADNCPDEPNTDQTDTDGDGSGDVCDPIADLQRRVASGSDDAEESLAGAVNVADGDLELVFDGENQTVGLRFTALDLPANANITAAYIQFQADEDHSAEATLTIEGQASANAGTFTATPGDISSRQRTLASVTWLPQPWVTGEQGEAQRTDDITPVIQEIVSGPGWAPGNALAILITGSGKRVAEAYESDPQWAPLLHVEYLLEDPDTDGDGVANDEDNCPELSNPDQSDLDGDGLGDVCDPCPNGADDDADGVCNDVDNCPGAGNPDQEDADADGLGNACDSCPLDAANDGDGDGVCGDADNCPLVSNPDQSDLDGDGLGDACECPAGTDDSDGDGICSDADNCPAAANPDQQDADSDGLGNACDACPVDLANDADGDGLCAGQDNCPWVANPDQQDTDSDDRGDACDACPVDPANDTDGDGVCGDVDNCPSVFNPNQADSDGNGEGDVCDLPPSIGGWTIDSSLSHVTLIGSSPGMAEQSVSVGAAEAPDDWRTLDEIAFPKVDFAFGEFVQVNQIPGLTRGTYDPATGMMTLSMPVIASDSSGGQASLTLHLTTESVDGTFPDGSQLCLEQPSDPSVCQGSRLDPLTGAFELVAAETVPGGSGTIVDLELLLVEISGVIDVTDSDGDGVPGFLDNCPQTSNPDQQDGNGDGIGDACAGCNDVDGDGVCSSEDNCPSLSNPGQADADADGAGDTCDVCPADAENDFDGDALCGNVDNCPFVANPDQSDSDGDGDGDACDVCPGATDTDGDGVCGNTDNCPSAPNPDQADTDQDGLGDACDPCPLEATNDVDEDGVCSISDNCPELFNPEQSDADNDGLGDLCDACPFDAANDGDDDGICGDADNCPADSNAGQQDVDTDGVGDACDNCFIEWNVSQDDTDGDGIGDACDNPPGSANWTLIEGASSAGLFGSVRAIPNQSMPAIAAAPPFDWRPLDYVALPTLDFAFGTFVTLEQNGPASGTHDAATGATTLELPIRLTDSDGKSVDLIASLTTEQTNGSTPDGGQICTGLPGQSSVCEGTRRDTLSGAVRFVAIVEIPPQSGVGPEGELLFLEIESFIDTTDSDGDGVHEFVDNCALLANPEQADSDLDGVGDACDPCPGTADGDRDGVCDDIDNCLDYPNPDQSDDDADGQGDACDACTDLDGDGFGSPGDAACARGGAPDCNDLDASVFPGGAELCDGADNDCNVAVDEATCEDFDVDGDATVGGTELAWVAQSFGLCSPNPVLEWWFPVDFNGDGCIDGLDLSVLSSVWGCAAGPICK